MVPTQLLLFVFVLVVVQDVNAVVFNATQERQKQLAQCSTDTDTAYKGKYYRDLKTDNAAACCAACQQDPACNVWTFRAQFLDKLLGTKTCYLFKDSSYVDEIRDDNAFVSGIREREKVPFPKIKFEEDTDYKEKNLYTAKLKTANGCADFCAKRLLCKTFTYKKDTKSCYGKRGTWSKTKADNMVSGVVW